MTRLILVRHGQTEKNIGDKLHQAEDSETLNQEGVQQIRKTATALKNENAAAVYSSNEIRAIDSGKILSEKLGIPLQVISGMQERNWGDFADRPWLEVEVILKSMFLDERYNYIPPNGESWKKTEERLISALNKILNENQEKVIIVVSHGGAIRILMSYLLGAPKEETFKHNPDNGSITIFEYNGKKFFKKTVNDTGHLSD